MQEAIQEAKYGIENNDGGPFGAIIVKENRIIGRGHNCVPAMNDPTAHAEINAIREACQAVNSFSLEGCEIYTSCEPCPMCLAAIYWARLDKIYYAADIKDAAAIGFDDRFFYQEIKKQIPERRIPEIQLNPEEAQGIMAEWYSKEDKIRY